MQKIYEMIDNFYKQSNLESSIEFNSLGMLLAFEIVQMPYEVQEMAWETVVDALIISDDDEIYKDYIIDGAKQVVYTSDQLKFLINGMTQVSLSIFSFINSIQVMKEIDNPESSIKDAIVQMENLKHELETNLQERVYEIPHCLIQ